MGGGEAAKEEVTEEEDEEPVEIKLTGLVELNGIESKVSNDSFKDVIEEETPMGTPLEEVSIADSDVASDINVPLKPVEDIEDIVPEPTVEVVEEKIEVEEKKNKDAKEKEG